MIEGYRGKKLKCLGWGSGFGKFLYGFVFKGFMLWFMELRNGVSLFYFFGYG